MGLAGGGSRVPHLDPPRRARGAHVYPVTWLGIWAWAAGRVWGAGPGERSRPPRGRDHHGRALGRACRGAAVPGPTHAPGAPLMPEDVTRVACTGVAPAVPRRVGLLGRGSVCCSPGIGRERQREGGPRSRRRPLSATQHHPTTSLVG